MTLTGDRGGYIAAATVFADVGLMHQSVGL